MGNSPLCLDEWYWKYFMVISPILFKLKLEKIYQKQTSHSRRYVDSSSVIQCFLNLINFDIIYLYFGSRKSTGKDCCDKPIIKG